MSTVTVSTAGGAPVDSDSEQLARGHWQVALQVSLSGLLDASTYHDRKRRRRCRTFNTKLAGQISLNIRVMMAGNQTHGFRVYSPFKFRL